MKGSEKIEAVRANTLADSISVDLPRDGVRAVRAASQTGGSYVIVEDTKILEAIAVLGRVGIFAEPAGATSYAGLQAALAKGLVSPADQIVVLNTGSGLKDIKAAMQAVQAAPVIEPSLHALKKHLEK
jgi:threonine synthase